MHPTCREVYRSIGMALMIMGLILELLQGLTAYRTMEWKDMLANAMGVAMGHLLARTRVSGMLTTLGEGSLHPVVMRFVKDLGDVFMYSPNHNRR